MGKQRKVEEVTNTPQHVPHDTYTARIWLLHLNATMGVSWGKMGAFLGVPAGTLWAIANGGSIPSKWKHRLGVYYDRKLWDMPVKELRWAIENRTAVKN